MTRYVFTHPPGGDRTTMSMIREKKRVGVIPFGEALTDKLPLHAAVYANPGHTLNDIVGHAITVTVDVEDGLEDGHVERRHPNDGLPVLDCIVIGSLVGALVGLTAVVGGASTEQAALVTVAVPVLSTIATALWRRWRNARGR